MVVTFYIHTNSVWEFQLLHILTNTWYCHVLNFRHSNRCGFNLHYVILISLMTNDVEYLFMWLFTICISFLWNIYSDLLSTFGTGCFCFYFLPVACLIIFSVATSSFCILHLPHDDDLVPQILRLIVNIFCHKKTFCYQSWKPLKVISVVFFALCNFWPTISWTSLMSSRFPSDLFCI